MEVVHSGSGSQEIVDKVAGVQLDAVNETCDTKDGRRMVEGW